MSDHVWVECDDVNCGGSCNACCLSICANCGLVEGSLTTECPGVQCFAERNEAIYAGKIDFRGGAWVEADATITAMQKAADKRF